jgi:3-oxoacyl-[acyl-carrier protein] reductase
VKVAPTAAPARVALIPGGAKGIGQRIAVDLARRGWSVAVAYRTSREAAEDTVRQVAGAGGKGRAVAADVSVPADCERLVKAVTDWQGRVDALVNCAGPFHRVDLFSETPEGWHEMFANNLDCLFYLARLVAPGMIERQWGRIIAFSMSNADRLVAQPQLTAHYLAKVGVLGLVRTLSKSLARHHITVNAISPGFIDSGSMGEEELKAMSRNIPAGYVGSTADASNLALYLVSDEAAYVTGANIPVSGGWGW